MLGAAVSIDLDGDTLDIDVARTEKSKWDDENVIDLINGPEMPPRKFYFCLNFHKVEIPV